MRDPAPQLRRADLDALTPAEIDRAHREGRLAAVLSGAEPVATENEAGEQAHLGSADQGARVSSFVGQLDEADLARLSPYEIDRAHREGRCARLLGQ